MPKLSELDPNQIEVVKKVEPQPQGGGLRLSDLNPDEIEVVKVNVPPAESFVESASKTALEGIKSFGRAVDSVTGAPARSALMEFVRGSGSIPAPVQKIGDVELPRSRFLGTDVSRPGPVTPSAIETAGKAAKAFAGQFAEDPSKAPSGRQIAQEMGLSTGESIPTPFIDITGKKINLSPADTAGFGIDVLADPTLLVPAGMVAKGGAKLAGRGAARLGKAAGRAVSRMVPGGIKAAGKGAGEVVSEAARASKAAYEKLFKPTISEDFADLAAIAERNGIDTKVLPESIEFGDTSLISRAARTKREGILGEQALNKFEDGLRQVRDATDSKIAQIGGGQVLDPVEAGNVIRQGYDQAADALFDSVDVSYNTIIKDFPGLLIHPDEVAKLESALSGIEKFAKGRVARGVTDLQRKQGADLLKAVDAIRQTNGSFKQTVEALRDVGEAAFKPQNTLAALPADTNRLRKLYGDITDSLIGTVEKSVENGVVEAGALRINNNRMAEFFSDRSAVAKIVGNPNMAPENVFRSLILNGDTQRIEALKRILPPEDLQQLKAAAVNALIKREDDFSFSFPKLKSAMRNKKVVLETLLSPEELAEVSDLVRLGDRFGVAVMSTSGTGASNVFKDILGGMQQGITNDAFIEALKRRARGSDRIPDRIELPGFDSRPVLSAGQPIGSPQATPAMPGFGVPKRSKSEQAAEAAQVISVEDQRREAILRRLQKGRE